MGRAVYEFCCLCTGIDGSPKTLLYSHLKTKNNQNHLYTAVPYPIILSVIVPTRNRPHLLGRALQSVAAQELNSFEVCVVDNNTDQRISNEVKKTVEAWAEKAPQIRWMYIHSQKRFASGARNDGLLATTGKYVAFLDDDDELLPGSLTLRMQQLDANPQLALVYCAGYSLIYPYPFKMYRYYHYSPVKHQNRLLMMSCSSIMINRALFQNHNLYFDEKQSRMDDYDLCRRILELNLPVKSIPQPLVLIHLHPETRISSHQLSSYDFREALIQRWGTSADEVVFDYAQGVHLWRKCFGIAREGYTDVMTSIKNDFGKAPPLSFRLKYWLVSASPQVYLLAYHALLSVSQYFRNRAAKKAEQAIR